MSLIPYFLFGASIGFILIAIFTTNSWRIPTAASILCTLLLLTALLFSSQPINDRPSPPFILYAASGDYAWVGPMDQSPPRTYTWNVPNELQELLQERALVIEEMGEEGTEEATEHFPFGEWQVSPFVPERMQK